MKAEVTDLNEFQWREIRFKRFLLRDVVCVSPQQGGTIWQFKESGELCGTAWDYRCVNAYKTEILKRVKANGGY